MHAERDTYSGYIPEVAGDCVMILMVLCKEITAGDLKMGGRGTTLKTLNSEPRVTELVCKMQLAMHSN